MDQRKPNIQLPDPAQESLVEGPRGLWSDEHASVGTDFHEFHDHGEAYGETLRLAEDGAVPGRQRTRGRMFGQFVIELLIALVIAFALTWCLKTFVLQPYEVPSGSMEPTIMTGDKIFADKVTYFFSSVEKGNIIVFQDLVDPDRVLVKRVVGLPGDVIELKNGHVYVNDKWLYEYYTHETETFEPDQGERHVEITYPFTVPEGCVWVMGDNRTSSADSRVFGPVSMDSIQGHVFMVFWPLNEIRILA